MKTKIISNVKGYQNLFKLSDVEINYSDGKETEDYLYKEIIKSKNKEDFVSLEDKIINWPSKYHFNWYRTNILLPIKFNKDEKILELGGGTGIITKELCKDGNFVITTEGTFSRARIIAERCSDYDKLQIIVGNIFSDKFNSLVSQYKYDKILLIGVLEYAQKYDNNHLDPVSYLLKLCYSLLNANGQLIIAIENKLGLKYLLGYNEDHTNIPHYGTQSLYKKHNDVITYSSSELRMMLFESGFERSKFYYPFPDYKLPNIIVSEEYYNSQTSMNLIADVLFDMQSKNYNDRLGKQLQEGAILNNFIYSKNLELVSNSFLIVSSKNKISIDENSLLYYISKNRRNKYKNALVFYLKNSQLTKRRIWKDQHHLKGLLSFNPEGNEEIVVDGRNLMFIFKNLYQHNCFNEFIFYVEIYLSYLMDNAKKLGNRNFELLPQNIILNKDNQLSHFDCNEWECEFVLNYQTIFARFLFLNNDILKWMIQNYNLKYYGNFVKDTNNILKKSKHPVIYQFEFLQIVEIQKYIANNILMRDYKIPLRKRLLNRIERLSIKIFNSLYSLF